MNVLREFMHASRQPRCIREGEREKGGEGLFFLICMLRTRRPDPSRPGQDFLLYRDEKNQSKSKFHVMCRGRNGPEGPYQKRELSANGNRPHKEGWLVAVSVLVGWLGGGIPFHENPAGSYVNSK